MECNEIACRGYVIRAMEIAGIDGEEKLKIIKGLRLALREMTADEAAYKCLNDLEQVKEA